NVATTAGSANGATSAASQPRPSGRQCAERKTTMSPEASVAPWFNARPNVNASGARCSTRTSWRASTSSVPSREPESSASTSNGGAPVCSSTASGPAARRGAEPEVPVLAALDEPSVVAADVGPELAPVERAHVDCAAREELVQREAAGPPDAVVRADEADPGVRHADVGRAVE